MSLPFKIVKAGVGIAGVATAAQEAKQEIEEAIGLLGSVFSNPRQQRAAQRNRIRRGRRVLFRGRNTAATKIQALFRGHRQRRAGRQRMQVDDPVAHIQHNGSIMPPRRRRRGRRAAKRKRRTSYTRKRRRSYRGRRKAKKRTTIRSLRLYPSGYPKTHLIKLRVQKQFKLTNVSNAWSSIKLYPAQCSDPFVGMNLTLGANDVNADHQLMQWTLKTDAILPRPQPYGWDQWALSSPYQFAVVEGSQTKISFIQTASGGVGSSYRMIAGYTGMHEQFSNGFLPDFSITYGNVKFGEISDMLNVGLIKNPKTLNRAGNGVGLAEPQTFIYNYSRKKTLKRMKAMGTYTVRDDNESNFMFSHNTVPKFDPNVRFVIADIGSTAEALTWNVFITVDYTLRLMNRVIADESKIGVAPAP